MITIETRMSSYMSILKQLPTRQSQVLAELLSFPGGITASELSSEMHKVGFFRSSDRNNVHPRLNEMESMNIVEIIGKKQCSITSKTVAVYKVKDDVVSLIKGMMS